MDPFSRRSQAATSRNTGSAMNRFQAAAPRSESPFDLSSPTRDDPLQPLRTMADRVGKEVERFAERVDHWYTHSNKSEVDKYRTTLRMVVQFKGIAESKVEELKAQNKDENDEDLARSTRRRIQKMADAKPDDDNRPVDLFRSIAPSAEPMSAEVEELRQWQMESATWDLLEKMIDLHYPEPGLDVAEQKRKRLANTGKIHQYTPNMDIWNRFLIEDDAAKEKEVVLRWLERTAADTESDINSITAQLEKTAGKGDDWVGGWLDTKSKLKQEKRFTSVSHPLSPTSVSLRNSDRTQLLVSQLDPDAPGRQKRALEDADEYHEKAVWMALYEMLRRGTPAEEITAWCTERNEHWRAVSMGVVSEKKAEDAPPVGTPNLSGPTAGWLFRRMAYYAATGARHPYEAALYGLLSGDKNAAEKVSRSWDDFLYAHYTALLLNRFDGYLVQNHAGRVAQPLSRKFAFEDSVAKLDDWQNSASEVIDGLLQRKPALSTTPIKLIQGSLIGRSFEDLVSNVGIAVYMMLRHDKRQVNMITDPVHDASRPTCPPDELSSDTTTDQIYVELAKDPHALRLTTHILIALRNGFGSWSQETRHEWYCVDNVIAAYMELLRLSHRLSLIPLYAAQLCPQRAFYVLGRVLPDIKEQSEQESFIKLMKRYDAEIPEAIASNYYHCLAESGLDGEGAPTPIAKYSLLEPTPETDFLWPGQRVKETLEGMEIRSEEDDIIEGLQWYNYLEKNKNWMFVNLADAMKCFLLHGRLGAACKLIEEMPTEVICSKKALEYCGYDFDIREPGAEEQDQDALRRSLRESTPAGKDLKPSEFLSEDAHYDLVVDLQRGSQAYHDMGQLVRCIMYFMQWRSEEDELIAIRHEGEKVSTKRLKDLWEAIDSTLLPLFTDFLNISSQGKPLDLLHTLPEDHPDRADLEKDALEFDIIRRAYLPDLALAYISTAQSCAFMANRETVVKAMEIANLVADEEKGEMLKEVFMRSQRMEELVQMLAEVGKGMLGLGEAGEPRRGGKRRSWKGETLRIWDLNVRN